MTKVINIKKGLDINLIGKAPKEFLCLAKAANFAVVPDHYVGITPKVIVCAGDRVKAGTQLMVDKAHPEIKIVSPVSGEVTDVHRGEKRKILSVTIQPDEHIEYVQFDVNGLKCADTKAQMDADNEAGQLKALLLESGLWPFIKQRPYDRVAIPSETPRDIFVTAHFSAPLAPDFAFIVAGEEKEFLKGLNVLSMLTPGKVYLGVKGGASFHRDCSGHADETPFHHDFSDNIEVVELYGPHPVGNVGVMINLAKPVNKGETVWTLNAADVVLIGRFFLKGTVDFTRIVALTGSGMEVRGYVKVIAGCTIDSILQGKIKSASKKGDRNLRYIDGNVLTGAHIGMDDYLSPYSNQLTVIPEGDDVDEFLGWAMPGLRKYSVNRSYFTWLLGKNIEYDVDARIRGGKRAMIMSNEYDKVFPMDILPEYLLKAIITFDIEKMENLGIYEVAPEDFALCEFVDTSKIEIQKIVREGLDLLYKEMN